MFGPWVAELATLVAVERGRVAAGAHLLRYADDNRVSESYRKAGEIAWLLCWPANLDAGRDVLPEGTSWTRRSGSSTPGGQDVLRSVTLPVPGA